MASRDRAAAAARALSMVGYRMAWYYMLFVPAFVVVDAAWRASATVEPFGGFLLDGLALVAAGALAHRCAGGDAGTWWIPGVAVAPGAGLGIAVLSLALTPWPPEQREWVAVAPGGLWIAIWLCVVFLRLRGSAEEAPPSGRWAVPGATIINAVLLFGASPTGSRMLSAVPWWWRDPTLLLAAVVLPVAAGSAAAVTLWVEATAGRGAGPLARPAGDKSINRPG